MAKSLSIGKLFKLSSSEEEEERKSQAAEYEQLCVTCPSGKGCGEKAKRLVNGIEGKRFFKEKKY